MGQRNSLWGTALLLVVVVHAKQHNSAIFGNAGNRLENYPEQAIIHELQGHPAKTHEANPEVHERKHRSGRMDNLNMDNF